MANNQKVIEAECNDCEGTGIFHGLFEPEGVGVICNKCHGSGMIVIKYTPFTGRRKIRTDIRIVKRQCSSRPGENEIPYLEFLKEQPPS